MLKFLSGQLFLNRRVAVRFEGFVELLTDGPVHSGAFSNIPNRTGPGPSPRHTQTLTHPFFNSEERD